MNTPEADDKILHYAMEGIRKFYSPNPLHPADLAQE